jgi:succinoglycan biosynthesis transport protein ExoP
MNILQFLRIFWARRMVIVAATLACVLGAFVVMFIFPPSWKAASRVMVNLGQADLVTGDQANASVERGNVTTQMALITDYSVAGRVVDDLNLTADPGLIAAYEKRSKSDKRDFRHWLEQLIIDGTKAKLVEDSAIIEITYTASSPEQAKSVADAVRSAFIQTTLVFKRQTAEQNAEWLQGRAVQAKKDLDAAIAAESDYERANGVTMTADKEDIDTSRLKAMSMAGAQPQVSPPSMMASSSAAIELASVNAQIAAQSKQLGPNNPLILQLLEQKRNLESTVAKEASTQKMLAGIASANSDVVNRQIAQQKAKVVGESDKIGKLNQLQAVVDTRRLIFDKSTALAAQQSEEALTVESGLTPLASASVPKAPAFPNPWLIVPGGLAIGLGLGVLTALLMEMLARRVRGVEDLVGSLDIPVLGLIAAPQRTGRQQRLSSFRGRLALPGGGPGSGPGSRKAAHA